jgi:hypothetical protein
MKALSEQLSDLAARAKQAEDTAAAARDKNMAALQARGEKLQAALDASRRQAEQDVKAADKEVESWWAETRAKINARFDDLRAANAAKRAELDLRMAQNRADDLELDAADAIDFATYTLDQAEYAVVDAVTARAQADELARAQTASAT